MLQPGLEVWASWDAQKTTCDAAHAPWTDNAALSVLGFSIAGLDITASSAKE